MFQSNFWAQFLSFLPSEPTLIGTVVSVSGEVHIIELLDGSLIEASSTSAFAEGARVFCKKGLVIGEAPELDEVIIEI